MDWPSILLSPFAVSLGTFIPALAAKWQLSLQYVKEGFNVFGRIVW